MCRCFDAYARDSFSLRGKTIPAFQLDLAHNHTCTANGDDGVLKKQSPSIKGSEFKNIRIKHLAIYRNHS